MRLNRILAAIAAMTSFAFSPSSHASVTASLTTPSTNITVGDTLTLDAIVEGIPPFNEACGFSGCYWVLTYDFYSGDGQHTTWNGGEKDPILSFRDSPHQTFTYGAPGDYIAAFSVTAQSWVESCGILGCFQIRWLDWFTVSAPNLPIHVEPRATGNVPVVPLPAAAWLFGSALLGFLGVSRRRLLGFR